MQKIENRRQLQTALNRLARFSTQVQEQRVLIDEYCEATYKVTPSDVDNDSFLDGVDGCSGACSGMSVDEFHKSMLESIQIAGIEIDYFSF